MRAPRDECQHDAMTAACEIVLKIESLAQSYGNNYTVATVGGCFRFLIRPMSLRGELNFQST